MLFAILPLIAFVLIYRYLNKREQRKEDLPITKTNNRKEVDELLRYCDQKQQERINAANLDNMLRKSGINLSEQDRTDRY